MAYTFDGTNQRVVVGTSSALDFGTGDFTVAAWWQRHDASGDGHIVSRNYTGFELNVVNATETLGGWIGGTSNPPNGGGSISTDTWYHAALVRDSGYGYLYLDGSVLGAGVANSATVDSGGDLTIASRLTSQYSNMTVAEVGVWGSALTADEIAALAKGISPIRIKGGNLAVYLPLIRDLINKRNSGIPSQNNSPTVSTHPRIYA